MSQNEYNFTNKRVIKNVETKRRTHIELMLEGYEELLKKLELLNQKLNVTRTTQESSNEVVFLLFSNCGEEYFVDSYVKEKLIGEVKSITINLNQASPQTEAEVKISSLGDTLTKFLLVTQNEILQVNRLHNFLNEKHEESMKILEGKVSSLSQQIISLVKERGDFVAIKLRNRTVPFVPSVEN